MCMKSRELIFCVASAMVALPGVPGRAQSVRKEPPSPSTGADFPVVLTLEQRDFWITIATRGATTQYTVRTRDGRVLAADVSADQLKSRHPDVYQVMKGALASQLGILDARAVQASPERLKP